MGRYFGYRVHPLTIGELAAPSVDLESVFQAPKDLGSVDIPRLMAFGGYPEPFLNGTRRFYNRWQNSRLDKIFAEDLRDLSRVQDLRGVRALSELLTAWPVRFSGRHLFVNADVAKGELRVEEQAGQSILHSSRKCECRSIIRHGNVICPRCRTSGGDERAGSEDGS